MADSKGYRGIVGFKRAPTWGTPVACGALDGIEVINASVVANRGLIPDNSIVGRVTQREPDKGNLVVGGPILVPLRYEGIGRLIAGLMCASNGTPATVDTSGKQHIWKIGDSATGINWTLAYEIIKDVLIYEFNTLKIVGLSLRISNPGRITLEVRTIGHDFSDGSAVNTTTTIDTLTQSANKEIAQARQFAIWVTDQGAGSISVSDAVHVTGLELNLDRVLEADYSSEYGDRSGEPVVPNGEGPFFTVGGSMTFKVLKNGTSGNSGFVANQIARTMKKAIITLTGDNLAGAATQKMMHKLWLPNVAFGEGKPTLAGGGNGWTAPFTCHHVDTAPTGFTAGYVDAVTWENFNKDGVDALL